MRSRHVLNSDSEGWPTVKIFHFSTYFFDSNGTHSNCSNFRLDFDSNLTEPVTLAPEWSWCQSFDLALRTWIQSRSELEHSGRVIRLLFFQCCFKTRSCLGLSLSFISWGFLTKRSGCCSDSSYLVHWGFSSYLRLSSTDSWLRSPRYLKNSQEARFSNDCTVGPQLSEMCFGFGSKISFSMIWFL